MPTFTLRGWYVSHDVKFSNYVTTTVDLPARPTPEQAERILFPLASADVDHWRGGADDIQFTNVHIEDTPT
jgi:hypothetical protein